MKAIVAVDKNWAIGYNGKLLVHLPKDLEYFKNTTLNKVVVMGRKTFESLPNKKPLSNRLNIILTRSKDYKVDGAVVLHTIDEVKEYVKNMLSGDVFIIGGDKIYKLFLPFISECLVTKIDYGYFADTYFPNLDEDVNWKLVSSSDEQSHFDITYRWTVYKRIDNEK